jgi:hypothetical protein
VNEEYRIRLGVDLGGPNIIAVREWDSENEDETEIIFRHASAMAREPLTPKP